WKIWTFPPGDGKLILYFIGTIFGIPNFACHDVAFLDRMTSIFLGKCKHPGDLPALEAMWPLYKAASYSIKMGNWFTGVGLYWMKKLKACKRHNAAGSMHQIPGLFQHIASRSSRSIGH
ncbi:MAG: hypothetical protein KDC54_07525, partial [Lewinella sp.]|nr:hypothetical protein [Lewinella sp.]